MTQRISGAASPARKAFLFVGKGASVARRASVAGLLALCIAAAGAAVGQEAPVADSTRDVRLHVLADSVAIGEPFFLAVTARRDTSETAFFRLPEDEEEALVFGDVEALGAARRERPLPGGMQVDSLVYLVAAFALDTAYVAPIPVLFASAETTRVVRSDSAWIPVRSVVPEDAEDIRDLAPLATFPRSVWRIAAVAALALLAAAGVFWWIRRRRNREDEIEPESIPPIPPAQEAFDRLDALEKTDLSDPRNTPFFYDELSDILRTYVARRLQVQALKMTTGETVARLEERDIPDGPSTNRFRNVLVACDYVKFADARPAASQGAELIGTSRSIIETMETQAQAAEEAAASAKAEETPDPASDSPAVQPDPASLPAPERPADE